MGRAIAFQLWRDLPLPELIQEISFILPATNLEHFQGRKSAGILIGIRADLVEAETLKWQAIEPGRLVHARCQIGKQQVDIVAMHQHAMSHAAKEKQVELMARRHKLWNQLDVLLASLPFRSSIILQGDFNMVLSPLPEVAGAGIKLGGQQEWLIKERDEVMLIFRAHRLNALNTWGRPTPTYHHPNGVSQIDYILVRKQLADAEARNCCVKETPIAAWRSSGHKPL